MSSSRCPGPPRHGRRGGGQPPGAARDRSGQHAPRAGGGRPPRRGSRQVRPDQRRPACCGRSGRVGRRRTALRRATAIGPSGLFTERRARFLVDVAAPTTSGGRAARSCNSCKRHTTSLLSRSRATPTFERWSATSFKTRVDGSPPTFVGGRSGLASCLRSLRLVCRGYSRRSCGLLAVLVHVGADADDTGDDGEANRRPARLEGQVGGCREPPALAKSATDRSNRPRMPRPAVAVS